MCVCVCGRGWAFLRAGEFLLLAVRVQLHYVTYNSCYAIFLGVPTATAPPADPAPNDQPTSELITTGGSSLGCVILAFEGVRGGRPGGKFISPAPGR